LDVAVATSTTTPALGFTSAGNSTQYIDGAGDLNNFPVISVVHTPDVWALTTPQVISNSTVTYRSYFQGTKVIDGTTNTVLVNSGNGDNTIKVVDAGTYEISFNAYIETAYSIRQVIAGFVEVNSGLLDGSLMANYLRVTGTDQGGRSSVSNTCYAVLAANDLLKFAFQKVGTSNFTGMQSITIKEAISGIKSTFSVRRIA